MMEPRRFGVEPILAQLAGFKRTESKTRVIKHYDEVYPWFLLPGFLALLVEAQHLAVRGDGLLFVALDAAVLRDDSAVARERLDTGHPLEDFVLPQRRHGGGVK